VEVVKAVEAVAVIISGEAEGGSLYGFVIAG
jgi:hypothetical protein